MATGPKHTKKNVFRVVYANQGKVYEIYARQVSQGGLLGFVEVEGLLFGERSTLVVDPSEEALKNEYAGVERTYLPMHSVLRIDEVEKRGTAKVTALADAGAGKVTPFPSPILTPVKKDS